MSIAAKEAIEAVLTPIGSAWGEEIQRRIMAADTNPTDSASWEEARDELIAELKQVHLRGR
jgi:hypothetical protein